MKSTFWDRVGALAGVLAAAILCLAALGVWKLAELLWALIKWAIPATLFGGMILVSGCASTTKTVQVYRDGKQVQEEIVIPSPWEQVQALWYYITK